MPLRSALHVCALAVSILPASALATTSLPSFVSLIPEDLQFYTPPAAREPGDSAAAAAQSPSGNVPVPATASALTQINVFDIQLDIDFSGSGLDAATASGISDAFGQARDFWLANIHGYAPETHNSLYWLNGFTVNARAEDIDGAGGILGSAAPEFAYNPAGVNTGTLYTRSGSIVFDSADAARLLDTGRLFEILVHEIAHVAGFGTLWSYLGLYDYGSGEYTGVEGLEAYRAEFDDDAPYVPVETDTGDAVTDNSHWSERRFAGPKDPRNPLDTLDLMTGFIGAPTILSQTTLRSIEDLGYVVGDEVVGWPHSALPTPAQVPLPPALLTLAASLATLRLLRRAT